jgi:hypothetical protein
LAGNWKGRDMGIKDKNLDLHFIAGIMLLIIFLVCIMSAIFCFTHNLHIDGWQFNIIAFIALVLMYNL